MSFAVYGIGTAVPDAEITAEIGLGIARRLAGADVRDSGFLPSVYQGTGNKSRYQVVGRDVVKDVIDGTSLSDSVFLPSGEPGCMGPSTGERSDVYQKEAPVLALKAATDAIAESGFEAKSITHLVTVSCTGFVAPGVDLALIGGLALRPTIERTHVGFMGCHGALNGLRVAGAIVKADPAAKVLLCAVELCSIHYHYGGDPEKVVANALFADGAGAMVGAADESGRWRVAATGSCLIPNSTAAMGWTIGDNGFEMTLARNLPTVIAKHLRSWMDGWLDANGLTTAEVGSWAVHPGGPKILDAVQSSLELPPTALAASREIFTAYGNMSSPTVLFIIDALRKSGADRPCVALGFGPGLFAEAVLWR
jgi:predicted naringenin-chalcone synthase